MDWRYVQSKKLIAGKYNYKSIDFQIEWIAD